MAPKNLETFLPDVSSPSISQTSRINYGKLPGDKNKQLKFISDTHVQSFDWFLEEGLPNIPNSVAPYEFGMEANNDQMRFRLEVEHIEVGQPTLESSIVCKDRRLFPSECRQKKTDYTAPVHVTCK
jgi:DNA-directed RNA polymerase beta subunit